MGCRWGVGGVGQCLLPQCCRSQWVEEPTDGAQETLRGYSGHPFGHVAHVCSAYYLSVAEVNEEHFVLYRFYVVVVGGVLVGNEEYLVL